MNNFESVLLFWKTLKIQFKTTLHNSYATQVWEFLFVYKSVYKNNKDEDILLNFYKEIAFKYINDRSKYFAELLWVEFKNIIIKNHKTKWGSCSSKWNLNFNFRIIMAPCEIIDYLIIHEICHLKEMNHSDKFWNLVSSLMPNYKINRSWLRNNERFFISHFI